MELSAVLCDDVLILFKKAPASKDYNWSVSRLGNKQLHPEILLGTMTSTSFCSVSPRSLQPAPLSALHSVHSCVCPA